MLLHTKTTQQHQTTKTTKGLILLIGAPGTGKSLLGQVLQISGEKVAFFSVGNRLREMGLVDEHGRADNNMAKRKEIMERMRQEARAMIEKEIERNTESILVLECVKDIHDAFGLMELLRVHQKTVKLLQVLYLSSPCVGKALMRKAKVSQLAAMCRDAERKVGERQEKWELNARAILEFFTSMGLTTEVVALKSAVNLGSSLANLGYASDRPISSTSGDWHSSLKLPKRLSFTPLQPVVSDRLVIDRGIIDAALHEAEEMTGLRIFNKDETKFIVPSTPIKSFNDAAWVTSPGRYCISRKCDGTRHVLIIGKENSFMLNRAGSVYNYFISTTLPVNTVLDGELVWVGGKGFFIAFDTISAGVKHARAWQLPLMDRVAMMEEVLSLEEADSCEELRKAAAEEMIMNKGGVLTAREAWVKAGEDWKVELAAKSGLELTRQKSKLISNRYNTRLKKNPTNINMDMSIADWEQTDEYREWHLTAKNNYMSNRRHSDPAFRLLHKKQQAPTTTTTTEESSTTTTTVKVVWKRHLEVSPATLEKLQTTTDCPSSYPTDGFVFTPREAPYALGMAELLKKWQPIDKIAADIRPNDDDDHRNITETAYPMQLINGLVYECFQIEEEHDIVRWIPSSIRWDKQFGNNRASIISLETTTTTAEILSFEDLIRVAKVTAAVKIIDTFDEKIIHPARTTDSILLYSSIMAAVAEGRVERAVDAETGLEIFNHLPLLICGTTTTPVENMCRGLVVAKGKVVATPFVRFSNELWPTIFSKKTGRASFKVDGALAIAFLWNGEIHVTTRRRMDSQQAIWARDWLRTNVGSDAFEPNWTYLFEAVFKDNAVVVQYAFDAAVLLAAFAPDGTRLTHNGCTALARKMDVMLAPSIMGKLLEFEQMLIPPRNTPPPSYEGWIVTQMDGSNTKRVIPAYKEASMAKDKLHPLAVWDRVRTGGMARDEMLRGLAAHHVVELTHILDALQGEYDKTVEKVVAGMELTDGGLAVVFYGPLLFPPSMHYSHWIGNKLRVLVMDCIKPDIDGRLQGYTPSTLCLNTIAKGWANGPRTGRLAARDEEPLISVKLHEPSLLSLIIEQLEGESMCNAVLVNKEWSRVMLSSPEIKRKVDEIKEAQILRNILWSDSDGRFSPDHVGFGFDYDRDNYDRDHSYDDHPYSGYGSN